MPLNPVKVAQAVARGLSVVCGSCERYWDGRDKGLPGDECTTPGPCGSPLRGDAFTYYKGPMGNFEQWCFRCGDKASHVVAVKGKPRRVALCKEHVHMLNQLQSAGREVVETPLLHTGQTLIRPEDLLRKKAPIKTLSALIADTESELKGE